MKQLLMLSILLLAGLSISCDPEFKEPLPQKRVALNNEISGVWLRETNNDQQLLLIFKRDETWYDIVYICDINSKSSVDGINPLIFEGYLSEVNGDNYLCFRLREKDLAYAGSKEQAFLMVKILISDHTLKIRRLSNEKLSALIDQGLLEGNITRDPLKKENVFVTSKAEKVEKIFKDYELCDDSTNGTLLFEKGEISGIRDLFGLVGFNNNKTE